MAAAAEKGNAKGTSLQYSKAKFDQYWRQLRALCMRQKNSSLLLSAFSRDPVQTFYRKYKKKIDTSAPFKDIGKAGPNGNFLFYSEDGELAPDALKADPAKTAMHFYQAAEAAKMGTAQTRPIILDELWEELQKWVDAESAIYAITVATLSNATQYIKDPEGAGRSQLEHLQQRHKKSTTQTENTLVNIFKAFTYIKDPDEGLDRYYQRLNELLTDMGNAKPEPVRRTKNEIKTAYRNGLLKANMFTKQLASCDIGDYDLDTTHNYLLRHENVRGVHLRVTHGLASEKDNEAIKDILDTNPDANNATKGKAVCEHYCIYGDCRFGDRCNYVHPAWRKQHPKIPRKSVKKKALCNYFKAGKTCPFGDRCLFSHEMPPSTDASSAEVVDKDQNNAEFVFDLADMNNVEVTPAEFMQDTDTQINPPKRRRKTCASTDATTLPDTSTDVVVSTPSTDEPMTFAEQPSFDMASPTRATAESTPSTPPHANANPDRVTLQRNVRNNLFAAYTGNTRYPLPWSPHDPRLYTALTTRHWRPNFHRLVWIDEKERNKQREHDPNWSYYLRNERFNNNSSSMIYVLILLGITSLFTYNIFNFGLGSTSTLNLGYSTSTADESTIFGLLSYLFLLCLPHLINIGMSSTISIVYSKYPSLIRRFGSTNQIRRHNRAYRRRFKTYINRHRKIPKKKHSDKKRRSNRKRYLRKKFNKFLNKIRENNKPQVKVTNEMFHGQTDYINTGMISVIITMISILSCSITANYINKFNQRIINIISGFMIFTGIIIYKEFYHHLLHMDVNTLAYDENGKDKDKRPILDSGASHHITPYVDDLTNIVTGNYGSMRGVTGSTRITQSGCMTSLPGQPLNGVLVVKTAARPLISVGLLLKQFPGHLILGTENATHYSINGTETILGQRTKIGWYRLERLPEQEQDKDVNALTMSNQLKREKLMRLHRNLGHASANKIRQILCQSQIYGLKPSDVQLFQKCEACALGKPKRATHKSTAKRQPTGFGSHLHTDNTARQPVETRSGKRIVNVIVCKFSNWLFSKALRTIKESVNALRYVTTQELHGKTEVIRSDQGGEYLNYGLGDLLKEIGAVHETSSSGVSAQNGTAEKCIQDIMGEVRTVLQDSGLPLSFWGEALNYCTYMKNRRPCYANPDNKSPYEMRYNTLPDYKRMQPFGQACTVMFPKKKAPDKKLGKQAMPGIMVGYEDRNGTKAYRVFVPSIKKIAISPDVTFMDFKAKITGCDNIDVTQLTDISYEHQTEQVNKDSTENTKTNSSNDCTISRTDEEEANESKIADSIISSETKTETDDSITTETNDSITVETKTEQPNEDEQTITANSTPEVTEITVTRPKRNTTKQNYSEPKRVGWYKDNNMMELINWNSDYEIYAANLHGDKAYTSVYTPKDFNDAIQSNDKTLWLESMKSENESIKENKVYTKVKTSDLPPGTNVISGKWVFKVKPTSTGKIARYKSRIVARGFQGRYGVDYTETYSPVAVASTIRLMLAITASLGLHLRGADVKTAFLYAEQVRPVYVKPPKGTDCGDDEVWLLHRSLYGLKDAPLRWHQTLKKYLKTIGMEQCKSDPCLFYKRIKDEIVLMTITVDDLLIAASTDELANKLISQMKDRFKITDLGKPEYVIGMHIDYNQSEQTLKLNQKLYIETIAEKFGQTKSKPEIQPASTDAKITKDMESPLTDKPYRSLIGSLIYATLTRPDIATVISQLSRVLENPQEAHWKAGIRVLRYLYTTRGKSLKYEPENQLNNNDIIAFTDSTWNTEEKSRSRSGYICLFNGCAISWKSKAQSNIARSSCEAEYIALNEGGAEVIWLRKILTELGLQDKTKSTNIWVDNEPAIALANHKMVKHRTKHIKLKYDWIREQIEEGEITVKHKSTKENLADLFTKVLPRPTTEKFIANIMT